jgi:methylmalonyl-CoA/ethylmalonyl-CoA epimerase
MDLSNATVGQILITAQDLSKGIAFYRDTLGLPFLFAAPPQMAFFMCGSVRLPVAVSPPGTTPQRGSAVYFSVADTHGVHAELKSKNVNVLAEPHVVHRTPASGLWLAEFTDPDGNQLALMSEVQNAGV